MELMRAHDHPRVQRVKETLALITTFKKRSALPDVKLLARKLGGFNADDQDLFRYRFNTTVWQKQKHAAFYTDALELAFSMPDEVATAALRVQHLKNRDTFRTECAIDEPCMATLIEIARRVLVVEKPPVARVSLVSTGTFLNYYVHKHHSHIDHDVSLADKCPPAPEGCVNSCLTICRLTDSHLQQRMVLQCSVCGGLFRLHNAVVCLRCGDWATCSETCLLRSECHKLDCDAARRSHQTSADVVRPHIDAAALAVTAVPTSNTNNTVIDFVCVPVTSTLSCFVPSMLKRTLKAHLGDTTVIVDGGAITRVLLGHDTVYDSQQMARFELQWDRMAIDHQEMRLVAPDSNNADDPLRINATATASATANRDVVRQPCGRLHEWTHQALSTSQPEP